MSPDPVAQLLVRTNELLSVLVKAELRKVLDTELKDPKKKKLYELTDGERTVRQLAPVVGMSAGAISMAWQSWDEAGLVVKRDGKYRRVLG
jgi:predicted Rossmann fold nucleotide-binding protein DprA/Smf involved in DNA uptake